MSLFINVEKPQIVLNNIKEIELDTIIKIPPRELEYIEHIAYLDSKLYNKFKTLFTIDHDLTRQLVSFQANKNRPFYRWYKYKEGFSAELVTKYIKKFGFSKNTRLLDPFAGSGTSLFVASELGFNSCGIELLPIGREIIDTRNTLVTQFSNADFDRLRYWIYNKPWNNHFNERSFNILKITDGAYPPSTEIKIKRFLSCIESEKLHIQKVLRFSLLCILENISYTRKDGQYLRWDHRSGRCNSAIPFDKGEISNFDIAITEKINEIICDSTEQYSDNLFNFASKVENVGNIRIIEGSCLTELINVPPEEYDFIITSPPYCNRYDYTRTYSLELALLGIDEKELVKLRQTMISCTVENKEKDLLSINNKWENIIDFLNKHKLLQSILEFLEYKKEQNTLNNNGIPRMIKGYFFEIACVISELKRILKSNGRVIMVNDNVRYAGAGISVDLIFADVAKQFGFNIDKIFILPNGKGNSSQQMGIHGREQLRKCVYVWRKE